MYIEMNHKSGGFVRLVFDQFFSQMPSFECEKMLAMLMKDYGMTAEEIEKLFRSASESMKSERKKAHLKNSYRIFRRMSRGGK